MPISNIFFALILLFICVFDGRMLTFSSIVNKCANFIRSFLPQDPKLRQFCNIGLPSDSLEEKTVTLVFGTDYVNVQFINFCCSKRETAKVSEFYKFYTFTFKIAICSIGHCIITCAIRPTPSFVRIRVYSAYVPSRNVRSRTHFLLGYVRDYRR